MAEATAELGNPAELERLWRRDGYWLSRNVIDAQALGRFRGAYMNALKGLGLVDADAEEPRYNGADVSVFPKPS